MSSSPRKVLMTADLHYGLYRTGDAATRELARRVCASDADAFIIAGDVAGSEPEAFAECLGLFRSFRGTRLMVPGNHDLWTRAGCSRHKYQTALPRLARQCGFRMLDSGPVALGDVAFIGSVGWYDYSMRNPDLGLTDEHYRAKSLPGICTWNDLRYVRWTLEDEEFLALCLGRMEEHYRQVEGRAECVVAVLHHLPFPELLYDCRSVAPEFCRGFMGSTRLGDLLLRLPKVRHALCGHRHGQGACRRDGVHALVAGSEYHMKRLVELDLAAGLCTTADVAGEPDLTCRNAGA